jgi:hypothetical protein
MDIKYHYICEQLQDKTIEIKYIESENNTADIFTKALPRITFQKHYESMYRMGGSEKQNKTVDKSETAKQEINGIVKESCLKVKFKIQSEGSVMDSAEMLNTVEQE